MRWLISALLIAALGAGSWCAWLFWPRPLDLRPPSAMPAVALSGGGTRLHARGAAILAEIARFDDEMMAYLMFDHLRGRPALAGRELVLTYENPRRDPHYAVVAILPPEVTAAEAWLADLLARREIAGFESRVADAQAVEQRRRQSSVFNAAYSFPVRRGFDQLTRTEKEAYLRRFVRFKSKTDPRVRLGEPVPILSPEEASQVAADILEVAEFFDIPLEFFLGIGAMENNFMNVRGDLGHAVWKRRAEKGDIVLRRRRGRVLVLNESSGVWQITRETLRYVHRLYEKDQRDYTLLPDRLRPPARLDLDEVKPEHLTTYAGLLFRDLLDRFDGDVTTAVAAYNGGPGRPNLSYAEGVERAAEHARRVLEQAGALYGQRVAETSFITAVGAGQ
jgi:hypothetical protein